MIEDIKDIMFRHRETLLEIEKKIKSSTKHPCFEDEQTHEDQHSEMKANLMLAYRHLEDARMRLGKVVQACDGGKMRLTIEQIAKVCHAANAAYAELLGETSLSWEESRESAMEGVENVFSGWAGENLHKKWCEFKEETGWKYGPVKDAEKKTHPCLMPYEELPEEQRLKDSLFSAIVEALR